MAMAESARSALVAHLSNSKYRGYCKSFCALEDVKDFVFYCYPSLDVEVVGVDASTWVIVSSKFVRLPWGATIAGPIKPARMVFNNDGHYSVEVLMKVVQTGSWKESHPPHKNICLVLDTFLSNSGYVLCSGLKDYTDEFSHIIRFQSKNLRVWGHPVRHDSADCLLWHKASNVRITEENPLFNLCPNCKELHFQLVAIKNRALETSPDHKAKWRDPSSNRPFKFLSPVSQIQRLVKGSEERTKLRKAIQKHKDPFEIELSDQQDEEMQKLVMAIEAKGKDQLSGIVAEAQQVGDEVGDDVLQAWQRDVTSRKEFFNDQLRNRKCKY